MRPRHARCLRTFYAQALPLPVLSEQGSAKFDKATRTLSVTLPVQARLL